MALWLLVIVLGLIAAFVGIGFYQVNRYIGRHKMHEKTVVRVYMTEESSNPEIVTMLEGLDVDELIGLVGALEMAKVMIMKNIPIGDVEEDEVEDIRGLLDSGED